MTREALFQAALERIAAAVDVPLEKLPDDGQPNGWRDVAIERIEIAREALAATCNDRLQNGAGVKERLTTDNARTDQPTDARLWCLHHIGPDEVHPAPDFETAQKWADWANRTFAQYADISRFVVSVWPHSVERHAAWLVKAMDEWALPEGPTQPSGKALSVTEAWQDLVDKSDRTSHHPPAASGEVVQLRAELSELKTRMYREIARHGRVTGDMAASGGEVEGAALSLLAAFVAADEAAAPNGIMDVVGDQHGAVYQSAELAGLITQARALLPGNSAADRMALYRAGNGGQSEQPLSNPDELPIIEGDVDQWMLAQEVDEWEGK